MAQKRIEGQSAPRGPEGAPPHEFYDQPPLPQNIINAHKQRSAVERQMEPTESQRSPEFGGRTMEPNRSSGPLSQLPPGWFKRQYEEGPGQLVDEVRAYLQKNSLRVLEAFKDIGNKIGDTTIREAASYLPGVGGGLDAMDAMRSPEPPQPNIRPFAEIPPNPKGPFK